MTLRLVDPSRARDLLGAELSSDIGDAGRDKQAALRVATLRRAAGRLCPCSRRVLVAAVSTALRGLLVPEAAARDAVDADLDALVGSGDLVLAPDTAGGDNRLAVYLSPPMFVRRSDATVFLVGGLSEAELPFHPYVRTWGPYRELTPAPHDQELIDNGLSPFPLDAWIGAPRERDPADLIRELDRKLDEAGPAGEMRELSVVDHTTSPDYYVGRFAPPAKRTGHFVARRRRKWGGRVWCYVELVGGIPRRFVDLPQVDGRFRGQDEAAWAICAGDAARGRPQSVRISETESAAILAFNMPLPMWAERRLLTVGQPNDTRPRGALLAIGVRPEEAGAEIAFLKERLWMESIKASGGELA